MAKAGSASAEWSVSATQARGSFWIVFVAALAITRLGAFDRNHSVQVPLVNWINDRSLYPGDPFLAALARYPSALWHLVALLARVFPLEGTLLVLFVLERLFALYAVGRLARALAPGSRLAVVAATVLFAFPIGSMVGYGTIVERCLEQTAAAIPCFLLAAAAFYEKRPLAWAVWLAAGFNLTSMYGTYALTYFGAVFLLEADYRGAWRAWVRPTLLFFALSAYGIYLSLEAARFSPPSEAIWLVGARLRGWSHYYPLTWEWQQFVRFAGFLGLLGVILSLVRRETPRLCRHAAAWTVVALVWLLDAFVAPYLLESRRLMMMQPARATDLFACLGGIAMIAVVAAKLEEAPASNRRRIWLIALCCALSVWILPGVTIVAAVVLILALPWLGPAFSRWLSPRRLAWLLVAWAAVTAIVFTGFNWASSHDVKRVVFRGPDALTRQLAAWADANTPVDSVFLLNATAHHDFNQFRGLAKRSIFTSTEEGTALYWAPDFVPEWLARLDALGVRLEYRDIWSLEDDFDDALGDLDDDAVARLKQRYRLSYWVVPDTYSSRFPAVWAGYGYQVLQLP